MGAADTRFTVSHLAWQDPRHGTEAHAVLAERERKEKVAVIYGEPETLRFLAAVQRLKREQRKRERLTRQAKQRVRQALRKMRA